MFATAPALPLPRDRRHVGIAVTVLVHAVLILGWHVARRVPYAGPEPRRMTIQWIRLPAPAVPVPRRAEEHAEPIRPHAVPRPNAITLVRPTVPAVSPAASAPAASAAPPADPLAVPAPTAPSAPSAAATLLDRARRDAGAVDRALRKENHPYIAAPLDSPQIRLRKGIQAAADMAPTAWYEAPKTAELVNNTGDGARRTRVGTGDDSYCITERSPATSIDMIEKHGKTRVTNCPAHESAANGQDWRTARD